MDVIAVAVGIAVLVGLLAIGTRVAIALGVAGVVIVLQVHGSANTFEALVVTPFHATARYAWIVIPLFILMGLLAAHGGLAQDLFDHAAHVLRRFPGGLGYATVGACAGFAAISGSSLATAATIGRLAISEMIRHGYPRALAAGLVAAAGTLGVLIPPSIVLIMYAVVTGESVGALLVAGIIPGVLSALSYAVLVPILLRRSKRSRSPVDVLASPVPATPPDAPSPVALPETGRGDPGSSPGPEPRPHLKHGLSAVVAIVVVFGVVMIGVTEGFVTITESSALAVLAVLVAIPLHRHITRGSARGTITAVRDAVREAAATTSMIFAVIVGAAIFSYGLVLANVPHTVTAAVSELPLPPLLLIAVLLALVIPLGMFLEPMAILLIVAPLIHPVAIEHGFSGVWLGVLLVRTIELGLITPPVGLNAFVVARAAPEVDVATVFRGIVPFAFADIVVIAILLLAPGLVLWLPGLL